MAPSEKLLRIVVHDRAFDNSLIARYPGEEPHAAVGGDLCRARPGNELFVFSQFGNVYDIRRDDSADSGYPGNVFNLPRDSGYGFGGVPVDPGPV